MTTPNFTPDFTKTGDVFVSRDGTELTFLCDDNDANNDPPIKLGRKGDHYWLYRNGRVFTHREHRMDIVSQYTPTTAPQGVDVPMGGDFHAFARAQSEWSQATFGTDQQRGPIGPLKHLEKEAREAQENPTDIYEFVDCLFLTLDASRRAGFSSESLLHFAWEKLTINKSRDWPKVTDMNAAVEHVREATPAPAAPVDFTAADELTAQSEQIGLYAATSDAAKEMGGNDSTTLDGIHHEVVIASLRERAEKAETLAAKWYRAFHDRHRTDAGEVQATTPKWPRYWKCEVSSRVPFGKVIQDNEGGALYPVDNLDGYWKRCAHWDWTTEDSMRKYVHDAIETDADGNALTQPIEQQQASGVERWGIRSVITLGDEPPYVIEKYRNGQFVKAADHDAAIATLRTRLSRAEQREAESEKYAAGILENLRGFLQLVELGCSVHRNAVVNRPRYYVADVDGKIVSEADEILVAMRNVAMPFNGGDKDA